MVHQKPGWQNTIGNFMKELIPVTEVEKSGKRFTNHSGRKTVVKKLKASNVPESSIVKVTGHSSVAGLQSYDPEDEQEFQQMSNAIGLQAAGSSGIGNLPTISDVSADHSEVSSSRGNCL